MLNNVFGKLKVIEQGPKTTHRKNNELQWWCKCSVCDEEVLYVGRDLKRVDHDKGCYLCRRDLKKFKYGKNVNGFIDRNILESVE